ASLPADRSKYRMGLLLKCALALVTVTVISAAPLVDQFRRDYNRLLDDDLEDN
ncbi:hypothetical protein NDU88_004082, partial [Pleurodeles waltl]